MCGISGFVNFDQAPADASACNAMVHAIRHRGPDNQDAETWRNVALGHARLSVIDLSEAAHQPMESDNGRFAMIYNGEVYNFPELRADLQNLGRRFTTQSDSEVVLQAYAEWGSDAFLRFNGMFALAILDRRDETITLARDRFGIKPLYYGTFGGVFMFASEIKAIEAHPTYSLDLNLDGLTEYLTFQNFMSDQTLNAGVRMFPAGHHAVLDLCHAQDLKPLQYWDFSFGEPEDAVDDQAYIEELDRLFRQALKRQVISDVPVGSYLSGGMDSGSITAITATNIDSLNTFNVGFEMAGASEAEHHFDESAKAEAFAAFFGTTHFSQRIGPTDMEEALPHVAYHLDEPRVGQSYPNYYAAKLARSQVTVCLSGAGGDELLAGYPWRYYRVLDCTKTADFANRYFEYWQRLVKPTDHSAMLAPVWGSVQNRDVRAHFDAVVSPLPEGQMAPEDAINAALYVDAKVFLHGLLVVEDKLSMAHALEARVPFLDNDLVEFATRLPARLKLNAVDDVLACTRRGDQAGVEAYFQDNSDGKSIFRRAMAKYLPQDTAKRRKQGFSGPDASWFRRDSKDFVNNALLSDDARLPSVISKDAIKGELARHAQSGVNSRLLIWSMLNLEFWLRHHDVKAG